MKITTFYLYFFFSLYPLSVCPGILHSSLIPKRIWSPPALSHTLECNTGIRIFDEVRQNFADIKLLIASMAPQRPEATRSSTGILGSGSSISHVIPTPNPGPRTPPPATLPTTQGPMTEGQDITGEHTHVSYRKTQLSSFLWSICGELAFSMRTLLRDRQNNG